MQILSDQQLLHRQYLQSDVWAAKRIEALNHYGCICNRCNEYGNDVHHKTYERVGGFELLEDLEILCRECHIAHHKHCRKSQIKKPVIDYVHRIEIYNQLSVFQKKLIKYKFLIDTDTDLYYKVQCAKHEWGSLLTYCAKMLGYKDYWRQLSSKRWTSDLRCISRARGKGFLGYKSAVYRNSFEFTKYSKY